MEFLLSTTDLTIYTYGSVKIVEKVFVAISMLFYDANSPIPSIMKLCASFGAVYAFYCAYTGSFFDSVIQRYFLPLFLIIGSLNLPPQTVRIQDIINQTNSKEAQFTKVDKVPYFLAIFSQMISTIAYKVTVAVETAMHTTNDSNYCRTGMIFGSETALDFRKFKLNNAELAQGLKDFSKQCVTYDLALGKYSLNDLRTTDDLWNFFATNTSKTRMIRYRPIKGGDEKETSPCTYLTCQEAINTFQPFLQKEKEYYARTEIGKNLPLTLQALQELKQGSEQLISQQLMMNVLAENFGESFAKDRAIVQQNANYRSIGSIAGENLVTARAVFEGLIYASFILIMPLCALPGGFKYLCNWLWLVVWIQLWPPFYAILHYMMAIFSKHALGGLAGQSLCIFSSIGLQNFHENIYSLAGYLSLSVPYLSYIILQGGLGQIVQLASSLMAPAQNAAAHASQELVSGNYSYGNASFGQMAYQNSSAFQYNHSPSISSGFVTENQGHSSTTYASNGEVVYNQVSSSMPYSFNADQVIGDSLQHQKQHALSNANTEQKSYTDSIANTVNQASNLVNHLSNNDNYGNSFSSREAYDTQKRAGELMSNAANWGQQYGLNQQESFNVLAATSVGGKIGAGGIIGKIFNWDANIGLSGTGQYGRGSTRDEIVNSALNASTNTDFQENLQKITDVAKSNAFSSNQDVGTRLSKDYTHALNETQTQQASYQAALTQLDQVSDSASFYQQNSKAIHQNNNQEFVNWASKRLGGDFHTLRKLSSSNSPQDQNQMQQLAVDYIEHLKNKYIVSSIPNSYQNPQKAYQYTSFQSINKDNQKAEIDNSFNSHATKDYIDKQGQKISNQFDSDGFNYEFKELTTKDFVKLNKDTNTYKLKHKQNKYLINSMRDGASTYERNGFTFEHPKFEKKLKKK